MRKLNRQNGFTLVELALVLVIIGLLLGGLLKGIELFKNADIKRLTADVQHIRTAYYSFYDRTQILPDQAQVGQITSALASADSTTDFFGVLAAQGFIGDQTPIPPQDLANGYEAYYVADQPAADLNNAIIPGVNQLCITGLDGVIAQGLDFKFDNGDPASGIFRAEEGIATPAATYQEGVVVTGCLEL